MHGLGGQRGACTAAAAATQTRGKDHVAHETIEPNTSNMVNMGEHCLRVRKPNETA